MAITFSSRGNWKKTDDWLHRMNRADIFSTLERYAERGVHALRSATPEETGETAGAWSYEIEVRNGYHAIHWKNTHVDAQGQPIAILLQYGHGTGTGGYVPGRDYINPAIRPIFDEIERDVWKAVK